MPEVAPTIITFFGSVGCLISLLNIIAILNILKLLGLYYLCKGNSIANTVPFPKTLRDTYILPL